MLRGASGLLVGLPLLEAMRPRVARAATAPKRFVVCFAGTTHGNVAYFNPSSPGPLPATLPSACTNLAPVADVASIVSGLAIPTYLPPSTPPPGGRYNAQHGMVVAPLLAGMHSVDAMPVMANGTTVDQIVADAIGAGTYLPSVQAGLQAAGYGGGSGKGVVAARKTGGSVQGLAPIVSPQLLFSTLFGNVPTSAGPTSAQRKRQSVLDFVLSDSQALLAKVSSADRARLDQHFTELRALEMRLAASSTATTATCSMPTAPPADPPIMNAGSFGGWSNESLRGDEIADILALALACDLTRSVNLVLSYDQSFLKTQDPTANIPDMHAVGHQGTVQQIGYNANWHVGRFAKILQSLKAQTEGAGTVLDNTVVVMVFAEGTASHNSSNMTGFIGGMPSAIKVGQHIPTNGAHPAQLMIAAMNAVGVNQSTLGEISGPLTSVLV